jgi:hypothetical protein
VAPGSPTADQLPVYVIDPTWPPTLPNDWILGDIRGLFADDNDHLWVIHMPSSLTPQEIGAAVKPPIADCCVPAPPVLELDPEGKVLQAWGGPGEGYTWFDQEHGIYIDHNGFVWMGTSNGMHVMKFTQDGKHVMTIGEPGVNKGSNDPDHLGGPANFYVEPKTNEIFIADGYINKRVVVYDAATGQYKRHWGAYGKPPDDGWFTRAGETLPGPFRGVVQNESRPSQYDPSGPPAPQFRIVHAVRISKDGLVYVCDRTNDRLQVFTKAGGFLREVIINKETLGSGSVWDVGFSTDPAQTFLYINDGTNQLIYVVHRETLQVVSTFGGAGHWAGQFYGAHNLAVNSKGDLFVGETYEGKRLQKFSYAGLGAPSKAP